MIMISEDEIRERLGRLAETVTKFPLLCYPTVRQMFPRKIRMMPKGKAYGGRNLYSMVGRILLNSSLATDFDRFVDNKKGEVGKPASPAFRSSFSTCEPKKRGFTQFEFGVPFASIAGILHPHDFIRIPALTRSGIYSEIVPLYKSGHSMPEISRITRIPRTSVRGYLIQAGVTLHSLIRVPTNSTRSKSGQVRWNSPYGFKYERGCLVTHPQEFETLLLILKWSKAGLSFQEMASHLNVQKLRPRSAKVWTRFTVRQIVKWHERFPDVIRDQQG